VFPVVDAAPDAEHIVHVPTELVFTDKKYPGWHELCEIEVYARL